MKIHRESGIWFVANHGKEAGNFYRHTAQEMVWVLLYSKNWKFHISVAIECIHSKCIKKLPLCYIHAWPRQKNSDMHSFCVAASLSTMYIAAISCCIQHSDIGLVWLTTQSLQIWSLKLNQTLPTGSWAHTAPQHTCHFIHSSALELEILATYPIYTHKN